MKFSNEFKQLIYLNIAVVMIFIYVDIFINLMIWNNSKEISDVALFNLISYFGLGLFYYLGTKLMSYFNFRILMFFSSVFSLLTFCYLFFYKINDFYFYVILTALLFSVSKAFYYAGSNLATSLYGRGDELNNYFAFIAIARFLLSVFVPFIYASVIHFFAFKSSLFLMILLSIFMFYVSLKIPKLSLDNTIISKKTLFDQPKIKLFFLSSLFCGFFLQFLLFFMMIFTFKMTDNQFYIALLNILYSILTFGAMKFYKKFNTMFNFWMYFGIFFILIGCFLVFLNLSNVYLLMANIFFTIGFFFYDNLNKTQQFSIITEFSLNEKAFLLSVREILLSLSRMFVLFFAFVISDVTSVHFFLLMIFSIIFGALVPFINHKAIKKDCD